MAEDISLFRAADMFIDTQGVSERKKGGIMLSYIEGHRVIQNLNELFDSKWSFHVKHFEHTYSKQISKEDTGKKGFEAGAMCLGRMEIRSTGLNLQFFEDVGYGMGTDYNNELSALESAGKEAVTDCMKRCARNLGNYFGLALYDKEQEAVLSMDAAGWGKLYKLAGANCSLETQSEITKVMEAIKTKYNVKQPADMKQFMWKELIRDAWRIYWVSFVKLQGAKYGNTDVREQTTQ